MLSEVTERRCGRCRATKPLDQFYTKGRAAKYPGRLSSLESTCKACIAVINVRRKVTKPWLKSSFGITAEDWNKMFAAQNGCCAICLRHQAEISRRQLSVDHDHETGKVRGLLCHNCNIAIGLMKEDPFALSSAAKYLQRHAGGNDEGKAPERVSETTSEKAG